MAEAPAKGSYLGIWEQALGLATLNLNQIPHQVDGPVERAGARDVVQVGRDLQRAIQPRVLAKAPQRRKHAMPGPAVACSGPCDQGLEAIRNLEFLGLQASAPGPQTRRARSAVACSGMSDLSAQTDFPCSWSMHTFCRPTAQLLQKNELPVTPGQEACACYLSA